MLEMPRVIATSAATVFAAGPLTGRTNPARSEKKDLFFRTGRGSYRR
jgi:hypothetical protein